MSNVRTTTGATVCFIRLTRILVMAAVLGVTSTMAMIAPVVGWREIRSLSPQIQTKRELVSDNSETHG